MTEPTGTITVGVSDQPGGVAAVCWAAREAALRGSPLRLVHAQPTQHMSLLATGMVASMDYPMPPAAVEFAVHVVRSLEPTVHVSAFVRPASPIPLLLDQSRGSGLVVVGNQGSGILDNVLGGGVCGALAARATCPVIAVNGRPAWPDAPIVVGITEPETALQAVEFGFDLADRRGVPVTLHQVGNDVREHRRVCEAIARQARNRVSCPRRYPDVAIRWQASYGDPVAALTAAATDAQLLVLGSPRHGPAMSMITRSVTHTVMRRPPCPIAVVPPDWAPPTSTTDSAPRSDRWS